MESLNFRVIDGFGHLICYMDIPFGELYLIKRYFVCEVEPFTLVLY